MMGPLVLAGFTHGERVLSANASLLPVPDLAQRPVVSLQVPQATGVKSKASEDAAAGCAWSLVGYVWRVLWTADRTRSFLLSPPATCVQRATPAGDAMNEWKQRTSGGAYRLNASASAQACAIYEGCLENGTNPLCSGAACYDAQWHRAAHSARQFPSGGRWHEKGWYRCSERSDLANNARGQRSQCCVQ